MNLLTIAHIPVVQVSPFDSVMTAVEVSLPARVGAVAVMDESRLAGIFTERDLMYKVVGERRDTESTLIHEVMTSPVTTIQSHLPIDEVLQMMLEKHIRHLPISEDGAQVDGMLSIRNVLQHMVFDLKEDLQSAINFIGADSPGG